MLVYYREYFCIHEEKNPVNSLSSEVLLVTGHLQVCHQEVKQTGNLVGNGNKAIPNPMSDLVE